MLLIEVPIHGGMEMLRMSRHAVRRVEERGLAEWEVAFVLTHGTESQKAGALHYFLTDKDLLGLREHYDERILRRVKNLIVLVIAGVVGTAFKNPRPVQFVARKGKRDLRSSRTDFRPNFPDAA